MYLPKDSTTQMMSNPNDSGSRKPLRITIAISLLLCGALIWQGTKDGIQNNNENVELTNLMKVKTYDSGIGDWEPWYYIPEGYAVCGAQMKYEFQETGCQFERCFGGTGLKYAYCNKNDWSDQITKEIASAHIQSVKFGQWGDMVYCPKGYFASDTRVKYLDEQYGKNPPSINALEIRCRDIADWNRQDIQLVESQYSVKASTWKDWFGEKEGYFITGSRLRFWDGITGIEHEVRQLVQKQEINIRTSWQLEKTGGEIDYILKTNIEQMSQAHNRNETISKYSSAFQSGSSFNISLMGEDQSWVNYTQSSQLGQEVLQMTMQTLFQEKVEEDEITCPLKQNAVYQDLMAKLFVYSAELSDNQNNSDLNIKFNKFACCYGAQYPRCASPMQCIDECCQTCSTDYTIADYQIEDAN